MREADNDEAAASMRPRFMNRGSGKPPGKVTMIVRSFNEAPIHESGKSKDEKP